MPGTLIPVVDEARLFEDQPEYALLLSWHIADELMPKLKARGFKGDFLDPAADASHRVHRRMSEGRLPSSDDDVPVGVGRRPGVQRGADRCPILLERLERSLTAIGPAVRGHPRSTTAAATTAGT